jgi:hypothetical protein
VVGVGAQVVLSQIVVGRRVQVSDASISILIGGAYYLCKTETMIYSGYERSE